MLQASSSFTPHCTTGWPPRINYGFDSSVYDLHTLCECYPCNLDQGINQLKSPLHHFAAKMLPGLTVTPDELPKVNLGGVVGAV